MSNVTSIRATAQYVELDEDDGSTRRVRARCVKNISQHVVKIELRLDEGIPNPIYHGMAGYLQPVVRATGAPEFLPPAFLISSPDGGVRRVRSAAKPGPMLYILAGQTVAIPADMVRAAVDIRCMVCPAPRNMTCADPQHYHCVVNGNPQLRLLDVEGNEEDVALHPSLEVPPPLPPVDAHDLHDRVMQRLQQSGGGK